MIVQGHVLDLLPDLDEGSVQCCVTSSPYWGLRSYGTAPQVWGGMEGCAHEWADASWTNSNAGGGIQGGHPSGLQGGYPKGQEVAEYKGRAIQGAFCRSCGAWRGELGLEPTPDLYIAHLVQCFREVRRVLKDDGVCWIVIGDSYATNTGRNGGSQGATGQRANRTFTTGTKAGVKVPPGLKPKDLVGVPWLLAFALRADGWYLRAEIIWAKGESFNPDRAGSVMPESVRDRPTRGHETVFLLTKSAKYYYDADAVKEEATDAEYRRGFARKTATDSLEHSGDAGYDGHRTRMGLKQKKTGGLQGTTRNLRSVWSINTKPYKDAHFATFPPALVEPMIKAGSRPGDLVLDPFAGSGTVGLVCDQLGRDFLGLDLSPEYVTLATRRLATA